MILCFGCLLLCALLFVYFVDGYIDYTNESKIKFTQFKNFYSVNPDRWRLQSSDVACLVGTITKVELRFGFIDYYRYKLWRKGIIKNKAKQRKAKEMDEVITAVKRDIAASEAKAKQMQEEFLNTLKYTYDNIPDDDLMNLAEEYNKFYGRHCKR